MSAVVSSPITSSRPNGGGNVHSAWGLHADLAGRCAVPRRPLGRRGRGRDTLDGSRELRLRRRPRARGSARGTRRPPRPHPRRRHRHRPHARLPGHSAGPRPRAPHPRLPRRSPGRSRGSIARPAARHSACKRPRHRQLAGGRRWRPAGSGRRGRGDRHTCAPVPDRRRPFGRAAASPPRLGRAPDGLRSRRRLRRRVPVRPRRHPRPARPRSGPGRLPRQRVQDARTRAAPRVDRAPRRARQRSGAPEASARRRLADARPARARAPTPQRRPRPQRQTRPGGLPGPSGQAGRGASPGAPEMPD
jgi:hypothetical protein